ncbi:hypothetical protein IEQ34_002115 [Dendrobium chrysotoxum]|uniref:DUF4378 domain-containing protein n=1 Tax=Dendrobium chrysotoxum TaxID=161865 RepID=A0AAV7HL72_DENCH|nr:hypothetical protein IEQ34_002115 [Dendrobium chrysotoxum]
MHRARSRDKPSMAFDPRSNAEGKPVDAEGYIQPRNYIKEPMVELEFNFSCRPPTEAKSITFDFKSSSSKKKTKAPLRAPLAEEMSIEKQLRRSSPTVIARLMGLDTLPSPGSLKPRKEVKNCSQKLRSNDFQKELTRHDCFLQKYNDSHKEYKDVFEVVEVPEVENHKNQDICKRRPNVKQSEMGLAFIRQSFINAKRLSTDDRIRRSKEFDNALEVLESNKDLFLKLLQEPDSLFSKHLRDLSHSPPSPHASHALLQKSSRNSLTASCESSLRSEIKDKRPINLQISDSQPLKKPAANSDGHPFREPMCSLPKRLSNSMYVEKPLDHDQATHIVILKPSLPKARKVERTNRSVKSWDNSLYDAMNHREFLKEEIMELYQEERGRLKLDTLENSRLRKKGTNKLPKDDTREMKNNSAIGRKFSVSKYSNYAQDDGLWSMPSIANGINSLTSYCTSNNVCEYGKSFTPLSSSSIDSSVNLEASKQLSERWRLKHDEIGFSMRESSTLGEMLALSDKETLNTTHISSVVKKACPLSISSKDGWKDGLSRNLPRSKSHPASSLAYGNCQHSSRDRVVGSKSRFMPKNIQHVSNGTFVDEDLIKPMNSSLRSLPDHQNKSKLHSNGKGDRLPAREIYVSSVELKHKNSVVSLAKEEHTACNLSDIHNTGAVNIFSVPPRNIAVPSLLMKDEGLEKIHKVRRSERNGKHSEFGFSDMLSKQASSDHGVNELLPSYSTKSVSISSDMYKEADQPSPVSVLELSSKDDKSTSGCFKNISSDLQELQMQLQFLEFDSTDSFAEEIDAFISFDEDSGDPVFQLGDILHAFRDEEDRDYSYLLDMLIDSGFLKSEKIELFSALQLSELPISVDVFNKLEKKYKSVESWSISERKLLFDLINSTLADISAVLFMNICPWGKSSLCWQSKMAPEGPVEKIWQAVVKCRKEISNSYLEENLIGPRWFEVGNDSEVVGRELENMLSEHLIDQLLKELIYM